jgi:NhaP-type Na+/H+ or K+/H+ antiporter
MSTDQILFGVGLILVLAVGSQVPATRPLVAFIGWMAPRGIVAAATASTFAATLAAHYVGGASKILAVTFLVIVATVALYGLTAVPEAQRLGVTRPARAFRAAALPYRIVVPPRSLIVKPSSACLSATSMSS